MTDHVLVLPAREVPLGGLRAMTVRRTLPHRDRSFVGAWCFVDSYGPDDVAATGGMDVAPHPHTGLQTVSWLFEGEIEHRDSGGVHAMVRPGEVNLMTSGRGIAHSEVSTPQTSVLHGVQLWVVLPEADRDLARDFQNFTAPLVEIAEGVSVRVFIGRAGGRSSPVRTQTPLLGAEVRLRAGAQIELPVDPTFEHALLVDCGRVAFCGENLAGGELGIVESGRSSIVIEAETDVLAVLLGGVPYEEEIVMWWNFIGRSHEEVSGFRQEWQARSDRFGEVPGYDADGTWIPAPALPGGQLRPRGRTGRH